MAGQEKTQLERELQSSAEMKHGQVYDEISVELDDIQESMEAIYQRKAWVEAAAVKLFLQANNKAPLLERTHFLSLGWDTDLFAVVDHQHTIEPGEECSICLTDLNTIGGRVRRLPCGHVYYAAYVRSWFEDMRSDTCPYCRHAYSIIEPPSFEFP
jgi:hypothetical protein